MRFELQFKDKKIQTDLSGRPQQGEFIRSKHFDKDLRVKRVIWTQTRTILELEDPLRGHDYVCDPDNASEWHCRRCNLTFLCNFSPDHPQWPEFDDCDLEIAKSLHQI